MRLYNTIDNQRCPGNVRFPYAPQSSMEQNTKPYKRIVYKAFLFLYIRKKELFKAVWPWPIRCPGHCPEWIRKARQKTKNMCNIPLLEEARKILNRYKEHPYCQAHSVLLPVCSAIQATDKDNRYDTQSGTETGSRRRAVYEAIWNCAMHRSKSS